jgi:hypothetical protein
MDKIGKHRQYNDFFARVDKLKDYKEKHGHVIVHHKEDKRLHNYCYFLCSSRRIESLQGAYGHLKVFKKEDISLHIYCSQ